VKPTIETGFDYKRLVWSAGGEEPVSRRTEVGR
jgi:hypothetical protein